MKMLRNESKWKKDGLKGGENKRKFSESDLKSKNRTKEREYNHDTWNGCNKKFNLKK